jgi:hypothetical protein
MLSAKMAKVREYFIKLNPQDLSAISNKILSEELSAKFGMDITYADIASCKTWWKAQVENGQVPPRPAEMKTQTMPVPATTAIVGASDDKYMLAAQYVAAVGSLEEAEKALASLSQILAMIKKY